MKLLNLNYQGEKIIGIDDGKGLKNFSSILDKANHPCDEIGLLIQDLDGEKIRSLFEEGRDQAEDLPEDQVTYRPAIENPEKILCVGLNYEDHINEIPDSEKPQDPIIFSKFNNALAAHEEEIQLPTCGKNFDYEVELVIVIGKEAKDIKEEEAEDYIFGYSIGNDLSLRDVQFKSSQWLLGKTLDQGAPLGPCLVLADDIDPKNLKIQCRRNGEVVQDSNTSYMIFDVDYIVSYISKYMTLKPGDIIYSGTPNGVIQGYPEADQVWLLEGDLLELEIENIGILRNKIVD